MKHMHKVQKGDSCRFSNDRPAQGDLCSGQRRKGRSSSPAPNSKAKTDDGENSPQKTGREESSSDQRSKFPCRYKIAKTRSCRFWHPPVCQNYMSDTRCIHGDKCRFRHVQADGQPSGKSKKDGAKGSVSLLKESTQLGYFSQDSHPRKSIPRGIGKL